MKRKLLAVMLSLAMTVGVLTGCGGGNADADTAKDAGTQAPAAADSAAEDQAAADTDTAAPVEGAAKTFKILSIWPEDSDSGKLLYEVTKKYQEEVNPNFNFEFEVVSSDDLTTKIATLMASDDLPDAFAYVAGNPLKELIEADKVVNISDELTKSGVMDKLDEGAVSILQKLSDTEAIYDLPLGLNIEGFWYNKALFEEAGVAVPATWDELLAACDAFLAKGIQPICAGGADKWPMTRLVNAYIIRTMGVDAVQKATDGEAEFTEEGYVKAAQMIADMAAKGYFGKGVTTVDQSTAENMLLSGEAAMFYTGSWYTQSITADTNPAGEEGIGMFSIPVVDAAVSPATEYPMNCGNVLCLAKSKYDDATADWLKYFAENAGNYAMTEMGAIKGFTYDVDSALSPVNQMVSDTITSVTKAGTWFEATMNNETKTAAQDNVQLLVGGEMTAGEYMDSIQEAYDLSK